MAQKHIPTRPSTGTKVESFWYKSWFQSLWSYFQRETDVAASSTASLTLGQEFYWPIDATSGAVTVTLPPANTWVGKKYFIKKTDASANAVTINRSGSDTVDGATSVSLTTHYDSIVLVSDGISAWAKVSSMGTVGGYLLAANNLSDVASRQTALDNLTAVSAATNEYVLTKDTATGNAIWKVVSGGGKLKIDVLTSTSSSSWSVPTGVTGVWVSGVGGGGGGGGSSAANVPGAGGGGSGERASGIFYPVSGASITYQCGAKGAGATAGGNNGSNGSPTTFGTISLAGGYGGQKAAGTAVPQGNGGGANGGTRGTIGNPATVGSPGTAEGPTVWGGAGGGGGGSTVAAVGAAGGLCEQYSGGSGGTNDASAGGGGGGAASPYGAGGAGGNAGAAGTAAASTAYGAGGGGAGGGASGATARGGGDGAPGVLYIAYVA